MKTNVLAPSVGESITEVSILKWHRQSGEAVKNGDVLLEIESDKATVEIVAEKDGVLTIGKQAGDRVKVGEVIGNIDDAGKASVASSAKTASTPTPSAPAPSVPAPSAAPVATLSAGPGGTGLSPSVRKAVLEQGVADPSRIPATGKGGRLTKDDVVRFASGTGAISGGGELIAPSSGFPAMTPSRTNAPGTRRVPMSALRSRIAERLVQAQHTAAILTTFNECDMSAVMSLRNEHKDSFKAKNGVGLSFMSFFTRAAVEALKQVPSVNASIEGKDIIYHDYYDVGIAVGTDRGLVVPVLRGAGNMGFVDIERKLADLAVRARDGKLSIAEMSGGTFTISNGGTYGSLLSTPILNPPQSGILGMHKIMDRAVVINGKVEARPMMYLALSYDHRLIDGKEAVTFLVHLKEGIENPERLGFSA